MILAAGLTPAWQQILRFARLQIGEVNRAQEAVWCGSGKVLNVAIALAHLGAECEMISPLGGTALEPIAREFAELGISSHWIATQAPTRVCTTLLDEATERTTELVENASALALRELDAFMETYTASAAHADVVVLSGSLTPGAGEDFYRELLRRTPGRAIVDARGAELLAALAEKPWVIKPNREELARTVGRQLETDEHVREAMHELIQRGAQWVVVTQGSAPVWVASAERAVRIRVPRAASVINPIGCGDCLAAGLAWGLAEGEEMIDAVKLGMAAAADNLSQLLPGRLDPLRVRRAAAAIDVEDR